VFRAEIKKVQFVIVLDFSFHFEYSNKKISPEKLLLEKIVSFVSNSNFCELPCSTTWLGFY